MKTQSKSNDAGTAKNRATSDDKGGAVMLPRVEHAALEQLRVPNVNESRYAQIAEAAYYRAEKRGFVSGGELEDWLAAEQEVDEKSRQL